MTNNHPNLQNHQTEPKPFDPNAHVDAWRDPSADYASHANHSEPKPWYKSKTVWLNGAVVAVGMATAAEPHIRPFVSAEAFGLITAGIGIANAALRFVTKKPIGTNTGVRAGAKYD